MEVLIFYGLMIAGLDCLDYCALNIRRGTIESKYQWFTDFPRGDLFWL